MTLALALLIVYSLLMIALGQWIGRRVRGGADFFVAGRGLSAGLIFSTFLAANVGAGSTVGATAIGYDDGLSAWWRNGSAGLGSLALAFWIAPRIWREASAHGDLTVGDFLERHYGRMMRGTVGVLIWCGTLSILAAQLLGIAAVLFVVAGIPLVMGCAAGALVTIGYFVSGGLLSSAWVNRVQLVVILAGFAVAAPLALSAAGGWGVVSASAGARLDVLGGTLDAPGWRYLFVLGPAFVVSPGLLQKAYGAKDARAATRGIAWNGVALLLFAWAPAMIGLAARELFPALPHGDLALPTMMTQALPPAIGALALAAVFSAEVSTADAVLFMLATSAGRDLYRGFVKPQASDADVLRVARWAAVAGSLAAIALATAFNSVVSALDVFYSLLTVVLFVPIVGGLYFPDSPRAAGVASVAVGVTALVVTQLVTAGAGFGIVSPTLAGVLASAVAFGLTRS